MNICSYTAKKPYNLQLMIKINTKEVSNHPIEREISLMEMFQITLKYNDFYTNIVFEIIHTMPL